MCSSMANRRHTPKERGGNLRSMWSKTTRRRLPRTPRWRCPSPQGGARRREHEVCSGRRRPKRSTFWAKAADLAPVPQPTSISARPSSGATRSTQGTTWRAHCWYLSTISRRTSASPASDSSHSGQHQRGSSCGTRRVSRPRCQRRTAPSRAGEECRLPIEEDRRRSRCRCKAVPHRQTQPD